MKMLSREGLHDIVIVHNLVMHDIVSNRGISDHAKSRITRTEETHLNHGGHGTASRYRICVGTCIR